MPNETPTGTTPTQYVLPPTRALDMNRWRAWEAAGWKEEARMHLAWQRAAKWISLVALFAAAGFWSVLTPYDIVARFVVTCGALLAGVESIRNRQVVFALAFAGVALAFNPIYPPEGWPGSWRVALVALSAAPFVIALVSAPGRRALHG